MNYRRHLNMTITDNGYKLMLFVQQRLYEGLQPDSDGYYTIQRKEFIERIPMNPSTFDKQIENLTGYYMKQWDLQISFKLKGLCGENLYTAISYQNGKLRFRKNVYIEREEFSYIWARKPLNWEESLFIYEQVPAPENIELSIKKDALK